MTEFSDPIAALEDRAAKDAAFREDLLEDPRAAIENLTGLSIPADWTIAVTIDDSNAVRIGFADDEIPEDYLALVAGGSEGGTAIYDVRSPMYDSCPQFHQST